MAYIGQTPTLGNYRKLEDISSQFDGVKTQFEMTTVGSGAPAKIYSPRQVLLCLNGIMQEPEVSFDVGTTQTSIAFAEAPETGSECWAVIIGDALPIPGVADNTITSEKLVDATIEQRKLASNSVGTDQLIDSNITTSKLTNSVITNQKLADNAVTIQKIEDSAVGTDKIANNAVNGDKIADGSVGAEHLNSTIAPLLVPSSAIMPFATSTVPTGWLECNGAEISRTTYSNLFAAIGTTYGAGDGSTTFALPDLRGEFIRGWDNGRGVDSGRALGTFQLDEFKSHTHTPRLNSYDWDTGSSTYSRLGGSSPTASVRNANIDTTATGGDETRPRNVALMYCIKI